MQAKRDLAITYHRLCGLYLAEGRINDARSSCSNSLVLRQELLDNDRDNDAYVRGMGIIHRQVAALNLAGGDSSAALRHLELSLRYYGESLRGRIGALTDRHDHASVLLEYAALAGEFGDASRRTDARVSYERAVAAMDSIAAKFPRSASDSALIRRARAAVR
jgi:hypothetical protein